MEEIIKIKKGIVGIAAIVVSIIEGTKEGREDWEYWAAGIFGLVAIVAPFIFGFSNYSNATWSTVIMGVLIAIFAGSRLFIPGKTGRHDLR